MNNLGNFLNLKIEAGEDFRKRSLPLSIPKDTNKFFPMSYKGNYNYQISFGPSFTRIVKILVISNSVIFILQFLSGLIQIDFWERFFALHTNDSPRGVFYFWQTFTYSFLHADFFHLVMNMLALWMFGSGLEEYWGIRNFLYFYLFCALGGAFFTLFVNIFMTQGWVIGASGAVFGIMVAYALVWPDREVLFMMVFPIKIKYLVFLIMIPMIFLSRDSQIAHMTHLGGALSGLLYWFVNKKYKFEFDRFFNWDDWMRRRKFKIYQEEMNKRVNVKAKVDELLDKISKHGYNSLSAKEKKFLNEASSNYRE